MLITFKSRASADVTLFGDVALKLIRLMGRRETVPSAMYHEDIPAALEKLRAGVAAEEHQADDSAADDDDEESKNRVSLRNRALPLIDLLEAAQRNQVAVMWEEETRGY